MSVHAGSLWIDENWKTTVPAEKAEKWLAVGANGTIAENGSIESLYAELNMRAVALETVTIAFFPKGVRQ